MGSGYGHNDTVGVLVDMDEGCVTFYKNGVRIGELPPHRLPETVYPLVTLVNKGVTATIGCPKSTPDLLYQDYGGLPFYGMMRERVKTPFKVFPTHTNQHHYRGGQGGQRL